MSYTKTHNRKKDTKYIGTHDAPEGFALVLFVNGQVHIQGCCLAFEFLAETNGATGTPLKIRSLVYSYDLISCKVEALHMPDQNGQEDQNDNLHQNG